MSRNLSKSFCRLFLVIFVLSFAFSALAQEQAYQDLLKRVKEFDRSVDFRALRLAYTKTKDYSPYADETEARNQMFKALSEEKFEEALAQAQKILEKNYVDIDAHLVSKVSYKALSNPQKYEFHKFVSEGLGNSILSSGDGKTPQTAYTVINVKEEYVIMGVLGYGVVQQSLKELNGHSYDELEVINRETGQKEVIYFNIDIPFGWLTNMLESSK